ncbi:MAG: hypothetical protein F4X14_17565 [Caldilineaceae bacterium SB0661_bin_32]|uniref:Uncharacterized protein n=1 Tax=Caldilineaceae bacterium SB0661_bin_32 TaxID=2605255 RepID=A0A6B1DCK6_9CHLR|nr:hypothetical protein [Caldilineaceae bacterium SB0661_bin_32]
MIYDDFKRNHVILPGRENALIEFLNQDYKGMQHKLKHICNSHSEDALTWSCFDILANLPQKKKIFVLNRMFEDAYQDKSRIQIQDGQNESDQIEIYIGKQYTGLSSKESTEVDVSIEMPGVLVFIEAKLYNALSLASPPEKPHDQIARKLRIGLDSPLRDSREFFFIFLDIAPVDKLTKRMKKEEALSSSGGFHNKWKSAWWFKYYKYGRNNSLRPLSEELEGIEVFPMSVCSIADNMGWLTWSDLFKNILQGMISE